jgi:hypothetical protein
MAMTSIRWMAMMTLSIRGDPRLWPARPFRGS